jgi:uncharacterized membrane protein
MDSYELSIEVDAPVRICYWFWRDFTSFPTFMQNVESVKHLQGNVWCWILKGDKGDECKWELILDKDIPEHLISWRTLSGPEMEMYVDVSFQPVTEERTRVQISIVTFIPDISLGKVLLELYGVSRHRVERNLKHFKERVEARMAEPGEVMLPLRGLPAGNGKQNKMKDKPRILK